MLLHSALRIVFPLLPEKYTDTHTNFPLITEAVVVAIPVRSGSISTAMDAEAIPFLVTFHLSLHFDYEPAICLTMTGSAGPLSGILPLIFPLAKAGSMHEGHL